MSAPERLRLAAIILNDIPPHSVVDSIDEWTYEDYQDSLGAGWQRTDQTLKESKDA